MRKVIVTTTINPPTEAIIRYDSMEDWSLVVIGDLKTPKDYKLKKGVYVSPEEQEAYDKELSDAIGWNCIQRRSFGLLWARDLGADLVAVIDDDNIPLPGWGENLMLGREVSVNYYADQSPAFDPVGATNHPHLWHRGFPLPLLAQRDYTDVSTRRITCDVQADFWNGDPDIDAICRMEHAPECDFNSELFPLAGQGISPFNSQNTFVSGRFLKDYFLFPHVGRMDDIWASFYLQALGAKVVYGKPSVYQERNVHDLVKDMKQEYLGYENNLRLVQELEGDPKALFKYLPERSQKAFQLYRRHFKDE
ncbi:hypothetical protein [Dethiosulfatarculus sandiegensis]|uniref:Glycosyltransferase 2-like domain-containing protein n=1 Tax=Dethiosulfatarculus sandiegensis TaxID=1429043 RepID=A0A0D2JBW5_9BACT|nr:hypothetical protein [Dethiosulfatarculus sandiegensis]KIX13271.1 hypothetical protein X474_14880 [Dethiosulfatarculus sandiegensis]